MHAEDISRNVKQKLHLLDQGPLIVADIASVELLQSVDGTTRDQAVQRVPFLQLTSIHGLIWTFDLDGNGGLTFFADGYLLVITFDGRSVMS